MPAAADSCCHREGADTAPKGRSSPWCAHCRPYGMGLGDSTVQLWGSSAALQPMEMEPWCPEMLTRRRKQQRSTRGAETESDAPSHPGLHPLFARPLWAPGAGAAPRGASDCSAVLHGPSEPPRAAPCPAGPGAPRSSPPAGGAGAPRALPGAGRPRMRSWSGDAGRGGACPRPAQSRCGPGRAPWYPTQRSGRRRRRSRGRGERPEYVLRVAPAVAALFPLRVLSGDCVEPDCGPWRTSPPDHRAAGSGVLERRICARARAGSSPRPALPYKRGAVDVSVLFRPLCARQRDRADAAAIAVPPRPGESASIRHHGEAPRPAAVRGELSGSRAGCAGGDVRSGRAAGLRGGARPGAAAWAAVRGEGWGRGLARRGGGASFTRSSAAAPWGSRSLLWRRCGVAVGAGRLPERLRNAAAPRSSAVRGSPPERGGEDGGRSAARGALSVRQR